MKPRHDYEWEIRGFQLIRGQLLDSHLGVERADTKEEAIAKWENGRGRKVKASCIQAILAPDLLKVSRSNSAVATALTLLGSTLLTEGPAWGVSIGNTLGIHTPSPQALVGEGAIYGPVAQRSEQAVYNGQVDGSTPSQTTIFTEETRDEAKQERNYGTTRPSLEPIDHGETCKTVYANHTQTECVTAGETATISSTGANSGDAYAESFNLPGARLWAVSAGPNCCFNEIQIVSPAVGGKRTDCLGVAAATSQALREQTGYLQACQAGSSSDRYSGVDESRLSDKAGGSPAPLSQHTRRNAVLEDGHDRRGSLLRPGVLGFNLSTVERGDTSQSLSGLNSQRAAAVRFRACQQTRELTTAADGGQFTLSGSEKALAATTETRQRDMLPDSASDTLRGDSAHVGHDAITTIQSSAWTAQNILGVLSVVACGMVGLLVLACGAMGGEL